PSNDGGPRPSRGDQSSPTQHPRVLRRASVPVMTRYSRRRDYSETSGWAQYPSAPASTRRDIQKGRTMASNRVVKFKGERETAVEDIEYPKLEIPKEVADHFGIPQAAPHAAILR